jgi:hypothetical protein
MGFCLLFTRPFSPESLLLFVQLGPKSPVEFGLCKQVIHAQGPASQLLRPATKSPKMREILVVPKKPLRSWGETLIEGLAQ